MLPDSWGLVSITEVFNPVQIISHLISLQLNNQFTVVD